MFRKLKAIFKASSKYGKYEDFCVMVSSVFIDSHEARLGS